MAEDIRKRGAHSPRHWGVPVLSTDPLRQPLPSITDAIRAGEQAADRPVSTAVFLLERQLEQAHRRVALLPYTNLIGSRMLLPATSFRIIASGLESESLSIVDRKQVSQAIDSPRKRQGSLVGDDGSETRFQMKYEVAVLDGKPFVRPIRYEQNLKPFEGIGRISSGGGLYGDYVVEFKDGEIDSVKTDLISCYTGPDNDSSTNAFLKRFLAEDQDVGYFYLNFLDLTNEPALKISMQKRRKKISVCEYKFGENVDYDKDMLEGHASMKAVDPGSLNFFTFLEMLEESIDLVPTI